MKFHQNRQTAGRVIDGHAFVITPNDNKLHTLNQTGTLLWELAKSGITLERAAEALAEGFEVSTEQARLDAGEYLADLVAREILLRSDD